MSEEVNTVESGTANVPNYLWQSIAVTVLCCIPFGIPAIVFAAKVNGLVAEGKIAEAEDASRKAKMWCWVAFGLGLVAIILNLLLQFGVIAGAAATEGGF